MSIEIPRVLERRAQISKRETAAGEAEVYDVSFSSETPVNRMFGKEVLVHSDQAVDMSRAEGGLPLLINHDEGKLIGRIDNFRLEGKQTRGQLRFDEEDPVALEWKGKIDRGIARDVSLYYNIDPDSVEVKSDRSSALDEIRINRWTPLEGSLVSVPADASVGVGRTFTLEDKTVPENNDLPTGVIDIDQFRSDLATERRSGSEEGRDIERRRISDINAEFRSLNSEYQTDEFRLLQQRCVDSGSNISQARQAILRMINTDPGQGDHLDQGGQGSGIARPPSHDRQTRSIEPGLDEMEKWKTGVTEALEFRFRVDTSPELAAKMQENPFAGLRMVEIGRDYLKRLGINAGAMAPGDCALLSLKRTGIISHTSSDYTDVLANIANKMLGKGYMQNAETWRPIVTIVNLPDYKEGSIPSLTSFTDLLEVPEGGEYKSGTLGDVAEPIKMRKFGRKYSISREAILNDDLQAFTRIPRMMGNAAARRVGDLVWKDIIIANPTLTQNGNALFSAGNKNLASPGALPNIDSFNLGFKAMRRQKDPDQRATLNIVPAYVLTPAALEGTMDVLTTAMFQHGNMVTDPGQVLPKDANNRFSALTPIVEPRLDDDSETAWYFSSNPDSGVVDTVALAFLNGNEAPFMEQQEGFDQDGVMYKIRLEATAAPIAYQGLYKNPGA